MNDIADGRTVFFYYLDRSGLPDTARDFGGQPACDASLGGGNHAQMPLWTSACLQGRCLLFDGADDFVVTNCQAQPPDSFTLGLSFFPRTYFLEPGPSSASVRQVGDSVIWPLVSGSHLQVLLHPANRTIIVERQGFSNLSGIDTYRTVLIIASCYAAVAMDEAGPQSNVIFLAATAPEQVNNWPWLETIQNGLFGVGDRDGDGMVSYEEAFSYAWDVAVQFGQEEVECAPQTNPHSDTCPEKAQIGDNADQWGHSPDDPTADYDPNQPGVDGFRARRCWP